MPSYPPTVTGQQAFKTQGYTKLWWGTEALFTELGYIVISARSTQDARTVNNQQAAGVTAVTTDIVDGAAWEIAVEEDLTIAPPAVGQAVFMQNVFFGGAGVSVPPYGATAMPAFLFKVENNNFNAARREPGTRTFLCRSYAAIASASGGGNPGL